MIQKPTIRNAALGYFMDIAPQMGRIALIYFGNLCMEDVHRKKGHIDDPVTIADTQISEFLLRDFKQSGFARYVTLLTEESAPGFKYDPNKHLWIIDELDGSKNFKEGRNDFSILLAMAENIEGRLMPTVGVVYKPVADEMFCATVGMDPYHFKNGAETRMRASGSQDIVIGESPVNISIGRRTFPVDYPAEYFKVVEVFEAFRAANDEQVRVHNRFAAGLEILDVASGKVDAYLIGKAANWDYAASALILQQADGQAYCARSIEDLFIPKPWSVQMDKPAAYYPALFTNGSNDASLFRHLQALSKELGHR